jgi:hypothetical protein
MRGLQLHKTRFCLLLAAWLCFAAIGAIGCAWLNPAADRSELAVSRSGARAQPGAPRRDSVPTPAPVANVTPLAGVVEGTPLLLDDYVSGVQVQSVVSNDSGLWITTSSPSIAEGFPQLTSLWQTPGDAVVGPGRRSRSWSLVQSEVSYKGLCVEVMGDRAWVARSAVVQIGLWDWYGSCIRQLPQPRYTVVEKSDPERERLLRPLRLLGQMKATDRYLWALFSGNMILVTRLDRDTEWRPNSYSMQFGPWQQPELVGTWEDLLVCLVRRSRVSVRLPETAYEGLGIISARHPEVGKLVRGPVGFQLNSIRAIKLVGNEVLMLCENPDAAGGASGPRWTLHVVSLPDLKWSRRPLSSSFQSWQPPFDTTAGETYTELGGDGISVGIREVRTAWSGNWLMAGSDVGPVGSGNLQLVRLDTGRVTQVHLRSGDTHVIHAITIADGVGWVAHDGGLSSAVLVPDLQRSQPTTPPGEPFPMIRPGR